MQQHAHSSVSKAPVTNILAWIRRPPQILILAAGAITVYILCPAAELSNAFFTFTSFSIPEI
jgi:hypothetical protein